MNVRHSCDSPEWYTPKDLVERARRVMGSIWLDPFSHAEANKTVKAERFYSEEDNGLIRCWQHPTDRGSESETVFVNPPGGLVSAAWNKLMTEWPSQWIWVGFSLEQLQTLQTICAAEHLHHPLHFSYCVPARRIAYVENRAKRAARESRLVGQGKVPSKASSPSHGSYIAYDGPHTQRFYNEFHTLGVTVVSDR